MRLNFTTIYEPIDKTTMQEVFIDAVKDIVMKGRMIKRCPVCKRWVYAEDFRDYCSQGMHEFSSSVELPPWQK